MKELINYGTDTINASECKEQEPNQPHALNQQQKTCKKSNGRKRSRFTYWDAGYFGDRFHAFHTANAHFRDPESTRYMRPLLP
jgi:hypothetical protein